MWWDCARAHPFCHTVTFAIKLMFFYDLLLLRATKSPVFQLCVFELLGLGCHLASSEASWQFVFTLFELSGNIFTPTKKETMLLTIYVLNYLLFCMVSLAMNNSTIFFLSIVHPNNKCFLVVSCQYNIRCIKCTESSIAKKCIRTSSNIFEMCSTSTSTSTHHHFSLDRCLQWFIDEEAKKSHWHSVANHNDSC